MKLRLQPAISATLTMASCLAVFMLLTCFHTPSYAQSLHKCVNAAGAIEYRNSPCEAKQKNAGPVSGGSVTTIKNTEASSAAAPAAVANLPSPSKWMDLLKKQSTPMDMNEAIACKAMGKYYVEGLGCIAEAPYNKNPAIGSAKMQKICEQGRRRYVAAFNECFD